MTQQGRSEWWVQASGPASRGRRRNEAGIGQLLENLVLVVVADDEIHTVDLADGARVHRGVAAGHDEVAVRFSGSVANRLPRAFVAVDCHGARIDDGEIGWLPCVHQLDPDLRETDAPLAQLALVDLAAQ